MVTNVHIDFKIKFRAFGITLANAEDHLKYPLPPIFQMVTPQIGYTLLGTYNDHGITIAVSLNRDLS